MIEELGAEQFCYVTTTGRKTGRPHEIEIWFVVHDGALFLMSGSGSSDWVKNMRANTAVRVRIGDVMFEAEASIDPPDVDAQAVREKMAAKYQGWEPGDPLSDWATTALVVRISPSATF